MVNPAPHTKFRTLPGVSSSGMSDAAYRHITYDPAGRPEVANLLLLTSLCSGEAPEAIADRIGDGGSGALKKGLTEAMNTYLKPLRAERKRLEADPGFIVKVLDEGIGYAREAAISTLKEVRKVMNMEI